MKTTSKEMTAASVGAEPRSGVSETNFNVISLPASQAKSKDYFFTVDAETLLTTTLPPIRFVVGELIPQGIHILAGSSKIHPDEDVTPERVHQIGLELAGSRFPGYEVVVATHIDAKHLHSHLIVNSVSFETGKKLHQSS